MIEPRKQPNGLTMPTYVSPPKWCIQCHHSWAWGGRETHSSDCLWQNAREVLDAQA